MKIFKLFAIVMVVCLMLSTVVMATEFSDVTSNDWFYENVTEASNRGWVNGYPDQSFKPNNVVTKAEAIVMISSML